MEKMKKWEKGKGRTSEGTSEQGRWRVEENDRRKDRERKDGRRKYMERQERGR